jgi:tetratricopeptide (TPR) repeat protein
VSTTKTIGLRLFVSLLFLSFFLANRTFAQESSTSLRVAQAALERGNPAEAVHALSEYLPTHPNDASAHLLLGQALAQGGQPDRAVDELNKVLNLSPENYIAMTALAEIYLDAGQPDKAEPLLEHAVKASHGVPQIRTEWAMALARLHEYQKAQSALAGVPPPKEPDQQTTFHRLKASVALGLGNALTAASEMEKALALKPQDRGLILATAAAQLQSGNAKRAASLAEPVFASAPDPAVGMLLLEAQLGANADFQKTLQSLRAIITGSPDELAARLHLTELLVSHGKFAESIEDFQRATVLNPNGELFFNLALAQFRAGQFDDALASAEKSKQLGDSAELEDLLGDIQESRGDNLAALKSYQAAIALAPSEEKYRLSLALEFLKHKSFDAAQVVLHQLEDSQPNSWRAEFALGMVEYFEGNEEGACPILLRAADLSPDPPITLKYVGDIQMDRAAGPDPAIMSRLCSYSDRHPKDAEMQYYCGALLFRRDYASENKANMPDILQRLKTAARQLPDDPGPHCQLGKAYRWLEQWQSALHESEICARLDPHSAQAHYRLAQIYHHEGQTDKAKAESLLFETESKRVADEIAKRDTTMKTFLYTIQKETPRQP